eukprot:scaffold9243_cov162-Amphora_coffeaeformis.AAC.9
MGDLVWGRDFLFLVFLLSSKSSCRHIIDIQSTHLPSNNSNNNNQVFVLALGASAKERKRCMPSSNKKNHTPSPQPPEDDDDDVNADNVRERRKKSHHHHTISRKVTRSTNFMYMHNSYRHPCLVNIYTL